MHTVFQTPPQSDLWGTPPALRAAAAAKAGWRLSDFDPCPYPLPEGYDGLKVDWGEPGDAVFVNPPFSQVCAFAEKAVEQCKRGVKVLLFIAARTENAAWQRWAFPHANTVWHLGSRVKFVNLGGRDLDYHGKAAFGSAIAVLHWETHIHGVWPTSEPWDWKADVRRLEERLEARV